MAAPTGGYPCWASGTSGLASVTEPTQLQKNMGWQSSTAPPAAYFNWYMNLAYQWIRYLGDTATGIMSPEYTYLGAANMQGGSGWSWTNASGTVWQVAVASGALLQSVIPISAQSTGVFHAVSEVKVFMNKVSSGLATIDLFRESATGSGTNISQVLSNYNGGVIITLAPGQVGPNPVTDTYVSVRVSAAAPGDRVVTIRAKTDRTLYGG